MKKINLTKAIGIMLLLSFSNSFVQAQCTDWNWPEDRKKAEEMNVLYTDAVKNSQFAAAVKPHKWLLENAPNLNTAIYINGEKIFKELIKKTKDPNKKNVYYDSLMLMYKMRVDNCGEEDKVIVRKAYETYKFNGNKKNEISNVLALFDKAYELKGNSLDYYVVLPYMSTIVNSSKLLNNLTEDEILQKYDNIIEVLDYQISKGIKVKKLTSYKATVDDLLTKVVEVDCDFVRNNLAEKFKQNPDDLKLAKRVFGFMLTGKCTDDPMWLEAGQRIQEREPEFGLAKNLGIKLKDRNKSLAEKYFNQALSLAKNDSDKSDIYMQLGTIRNRSAAREMYLKALEVMPSNKDAYNAIGYLYYQSFDDCKRLENIVQDRGVFLIAYDMFSKAQNSKMMSSAEEQFPSVGEIFEHNIDKGSSLTVGCWIQRTTTVRTRD